MKLLFDRLSRTLEHGMNLRLQRANMISANLANADTPGYTPVDIKFDEALQSFQAGEVPGGLHKTHAAHMGPDEGVPEGAPEFDYFSLPDGSGNSVDLDHESAKLAQNQLLYRATTKVYNKRTAMLKYAIAEGNG